ncbi:MAG: maleylpyruvate isomerase N-terminal domain-containing protein, partial [Anaerolineae bacterium]|nr:maleylpyruvate isomerase N-terminal domain-containing protein [Anaerolineae bacterium]
MNQKRDFIADFHRLYAAINIALANLDPNTIMHHDSGWRVRDILAHLAVWYCERIKCLRAYQQATEYQIPDFDMNMFNHDTVAERKRRPYVEIQAEWEQAHAELIIELEAIPAG